MKKSKKVYRFAALTLTAVTVVPMCFPPEPVFASAGMEAA